MNTFNYASLKLIEPLRCLRYIHFAAWIGKRWEDPAFQRSFPNYGTERYWQEQVHDIYEQIRKIEVIQ
jgi:Ser/Thr protein kinase RdoA (MazF antagonist)